MKVPRLEITEIALRDIASVLDHSHAEFGAANADRYQAGIAEALKRLIDPMLQPAGAARDEVATGLRAFDLRACLPRARHVLFFRAEQDVVRVLRLLHHRQDVLAGVLWQATSDFADQVPD